MKIVFVSNYYNHHQAALCRALDQLAEEFYFIATSEMRRDRRELGYGQWEIPGFVRSSYTAEADRAECQKLIDRADVIIFGSAPAGMIRSAVKAGKLILLYRERPLKQQTLSVRQWMHFLKTRLTWGSKKNVYLLSAGGYAAGDYLKRGCFVGRTYKWGYFPETQYAPNGEIAAGKDSTAILWVGRFLDWKHPEYALEVARRLKAEGYAFILNMIGTGPMDNRLRELLAAWELEDCVHLLGSMKPEDVRGFMEKSGIFLFTSDRQEGWGAVLNEAMNSGCAVVASHAIGSVPYLVNDGNKGLVFRSGDVDDLFEKAKYLLDHPERAQQMGVAAYKTITELWKAETAAVRLYELAQRILAGENAPDLYESGPVSRAMTLRDEWI